MKIAGAMLGLLVLVVVFVLWLRTYKSIRGDDGPLFAMRKRKPAKENKSLDEFIAAYKRGEVTPGTGITSTVKPAAAGVTSPRL